MIFVYSKCAFHIPYFVFAIYFVFTIYFALKYSAAPLFIANLITSTSTSEEITAHTHSGAKLRAK